MGWTLLTGTVKQVSDETALYSGFATNDIESLVIFGIDPPPNLEPLEFERFSDRTKSRQASSRSVDEARGFTGDRQVSPERMRPISRNRNPRTCLRPPAARACLPRTPRPRPLPSGPEPEAGAECTTPRGSSWRRAARPQVSRRTARDNPKTNLGLSPVVRHALSRDGAGRQRGDLRRRCAEDLLIRAAARSLVSLSLQRRGDA